MAFDDIVQHMLKTRDTRRAHLDLSQACIEIGGKSREFRGMLAHFLRTTIPVGRQTFLCHACHNDGCSNVLHLYWGTASDNAIDLVMSGKFKPGLNFHRGRAECDEHWRKMNSAAGGRNNAGKPKSQETRNKISVSLRNRFAQTKSFAALAETD